MMDMRGERLIGAPRQAVWNALNDAAALKSCLPGCERLERVSETAFETTVTAKVGPVKTTLAGSVTLSAIDAPNAYTMSFEGKGGAAGFAKGTAKVELADADGGTRLQYVVAAKLGGKLGQLGSRVVDGVAREMAEDFFGRFAAVVAPAAAVGSPAGSPAGGSAETGEALPRSTGPSAARWMLVGLALAALAVIAYLVLR